MPAVWNGLKPKKSRNQQASGQLIEPSRVSGHADQTTGQTRYPSSTTLVGPFRAPQSSATHRGTINTTKATEATTHYKPLVRHSIIGALIYCSGHPCSLDL